MKTDIQIAVPHGCYGRVGECCIAGFSCCVHIFAQCMYGMSHQLQNKRSYLSLVILSSQHRGLDWQQNTSLMLVVSLCLVDLLMMKNHVSRQFLNPCLVNFTNVPVCSPQLES